MKKTFLIVILTMILCLSSCVAKIENASESIDIQGTEQKTENNADTLQNSPVTSAPETELVPEEKKSFSFVGCGDNIIYYGTWRDAKAQSDGTREYNFKPIFKNVQSIIEGADVAFINQETICSQSFELQSYPQFNSPVDLTYDLYEVGFDVVSLANNHMLDQGALGLRESFDNWNDRGMCVIGCYEEKESGAYITYYEKNGIKVAFVAYTEFTNLSPDPAKEGLYAPYLKQSDVAGDLKEASENSDFVIVSVHWGSEGSFVPSALQKEYATLMANSGADVIIGHHPHVIQPIEWIKADDGRETLCAYSLGNFVHEQAYSYNVPGGILSFDVVMEGKGRAVAQNVLFIPTVCHFPSNFYNNTVYLLEDYTESLANSHAVRTYYNNSISLETLKKYVTDTISDEFLPDYLK